jgi:hypothetical protein
LFCKGKSKENISLATAKLNYAESFKLCCCLQGPPGLTLKKFYITLTECIYVICMDLHEIRKLKANWIGHILHRKCLLKEVIEGKIKGRIEVTTRRGGRRKQLLDDLGDRRGYSHLKEEARDRIKWRNRFGRGCGPVV